MAAAPLAHARIATADPRLIIALDVPTVDEARALVGRLGEAVGFYKIGLQLFATGGMALAAELKGQGRRVFLDWKLHDIGATVEKAAAAVTNAGCGDFLTVHAEPQVLAAAVRGRGSSDLKVLGVTVPDQDVALGDTTGKLAVVGWGSTFGPIHQAVRRWQGKGRKVSHIHVRHIWPLPKNLGELLAGFDRVLVPEMNTGQFKTVLRDQLLIDCESLTKTSGQPFQIAELEAAIGKYFDAVTGNEGGEVPANAGQLPEPESGHDDGTLHPDHHSPQSGVNP